MGIFGKKNKIESVAPASPPEVVESPAEMEYTKNLSETPKAQVPQEDVPGAQEVEETIPPYREVPVCLSQTQINNLVIENNMMLKQIITEMD